MPKNLVVPLTPGLILEGNYTLRLTALDPTTGNTVAGVKITNGALLATDFGPTTDQQPTQPLGPIFLIPGPALT